MFYTEKELSKMSKEHLVYIIIQMQYLQSENKILYFFKKLKDSESIAISIIATKINNSIKINWEIKDNLYQNEIEKNGFFLINLTKKEEEFIEENGYTNSTVLSIINNKCEMQFFPYKNKTSKICFNSNNDSTA